MRIATWNINGIKARIENLLHWLRDASPDVVCLQETKLADDAFPAWAALGAAGRAEYLHRLADLIDRNVERVAVVECEDMAMLLRSLRTRVIARGARNYRSYADLGVALREIRVHGNQVNPSSSQGVQVERHGRHEGLAFARGHLRHLAPVERARAD